MLKYYLFIQKNTFRTQIKQKLFYKKNIKFIKDEQTGIYSAMNKGIYLSNGEFIQFMDQMILLTKKI